jgi:response regulator RpfG family c-di-GMP phosphodiesterase
MNTKILFVDDDPNILTSHQRSLRKKFTLDTALGSEQGLTALESGEDYAVIVADMNMPGMNGAELLVKAQELRPNTVRIMLTGNQDQKTALEAVNRGHVYQFLTKPCSPEMLFLALESGIKQHQLITAEQELLEKTLSGSIKMLTEMLSLISPNSFGQGQIVKEWIQKIPHLEKQTADSRWELELAALLAPLGLISIPQEVLAKIHTQGALTPNEEEMLQRVPKIIHDLLACIPRLENIARMVLYQNKNFDGSGYPQDSLAGNKIPWGSRLLKILFDHLELKQMGRSSAQALAAMVSRKQRYDPALLEIVSPWLDQGSDDLPASVPEVSSVYVKDLTVGQMVAEDVKTKEGMILLAHGNKISPLILEKLRNFAALEIIQEPLSIQKTAKETS